LKSTFAFGHGVSERCEPQSSVTEACEDVPWKMVNARVSAVRAQRARANAVRRTAGIRDMTLLLYDEGAAGVEAGWLLAKAYSCLEPV
jgi:hypothetical protein